MDGTNLYYDLLKKAQKDKLSVNKTTLLKTQKIYEESLKELINKLDGKETYNQQFIKAQIATLRKELEGMNKVLEEVAVEGIKKTSSIASYVNYEFFKNINNEFNLGIDEKTLESLLTTNKNVVEKIISGGLYKDNKSLSERIWNYSEKNVKDVQNILLKGMIQKKPIKEICNDLKSYSSGGDSRVSAVNRAYGKMNANALRLVRTSLNHSFVETMKDENRKNPFVEGYKWELSGSHSDRVSGGFDICDEYAQHNEGLGEGVFAKNNVPYAHCNCMCVQVPYIPKSLEQIGKEINSWIKGEENKEIDSWAKSRGFTVTKNKAANKTSSRATSSKTTTTSNKFVEAKTIKEANTFAQDVIGIKNASYGKVDIRVANEWNKCLYETLNRFPELKGNFNFTGSIQERNKFAKKDENLFNSILKEFKELNPRYNFPTYSDSEYENRLSEEVNKWIKRQFNGSGLKNTFAYSSSFEHSKGIMVNEIFGKDYDNFVEVLKRNVKSQFHPIGADTVRSVADHEIGHQLDTLLGVRNNKEIQDLFNSMSKDEITENLSRYSWKNSNKNKYGEFIAEGWSEYCNNPNPRPIAKQIGETIERLYKEKFK